jgi:hypothetical protein
MVYVYAVREAEPRDDSGVGLGAEPLRTVTSGSLAAVVSDVEGPRPVPDEDTLWDHERVVEALMARGAVLPMRFGSVLDDDAAVVELLRARDAELRDALARVTGAIELGVRAAWAVEEPPSGDRPVANGAAYLQGLMQRRRRASDLAERIDTPLSALARDSRRRLLVTPNLPLSGAYLVDQGRLEAFRARVAALDEEIGAAQIVCTGPWPPYSFVGAGEGEP